MTVQHKFAANIGIGQNLLDNLSSNFVTYFGTDGKLTEDSSKGIEVKPFIMTQPDQCPTRFIISRHEIEGKPYFSEKIIVNRLTEKDGKNLVRSILVLKICPLFKEEKETFGMMIYAVESMESQSE